jgi:hypothetical protein
MPLDNTNVIDEVTAKRLKKLHSIENTPKLIKQYLEFVSKETHCSSMITKLIDRSAKTIIHNTMFSEFQNSKEEEDEEEFGEGIDEEYLDSDKPFEVPDGYDPVDKCIDVYQAFVNTQFLMQLIFSSGLAHGKAIYDGDTETQFEKIKKPDLFDNTQMKSIKDLLSNIMGFSVDSYEISTEETNGEEEINPPNRRRSREEDEDTPEEFL